MYDTMRHKLKMQMEFLFSGVFVRAIESRQVNYTHREAALEVLLEFCRDPCFMAQLYVNFDCDLYCSNLFETMAKLLAEVACGVILALQCVWVGLNLCTTACLSS